MLLREVGEKQTDQVIAYTQKYVVVPLDTEIAPMAADLRREHRLATADAIVYATARRHDAGPLTCDAHFEGLRGVALFSKKTAGIKESVPRASHRNDSPTRAYANIK